MSSRHSDPSQQKPVDRGFEVELPISYATYSDRWAIVVGISKYQHESLNLGYADRDAEALYELLLTPSGGGFEKDHIVKLVNEEATTAKITRALRSFLKKPAKEDIVLIYFACHGAPDIDRPGIVYLLTHDVDPRDISGTALPMREIDLSLRENLLAERVVILADTCHSAAIGGGIGRRDAGDSSAVVNSYLREVSKTRGGIALLTSAEANEVSFEDAKWGGGHGVFTHHLLEGMKGAADRSPKDGIVTVGELFDYVRENVQRATENQQHPCVGTNSYDRNLPIAFTAGISAQEHYEIGCQLYKVGMQLNDQGRLQAAGRHLQEAIRLARIAESNFIEAQLKLGIVFMNTGNLSKAIEALEIAAKTSLPDAVYYLGIAYAKQNQSEAAVQMLDLFLKQYPKDQRAAWIHDFMLQQMHQYTGTKYALLIGINDYPFESGFTPLRGCLNDVQLMQELLVGHYIFKPENIDVLTDSNATYDRILQELQRLAQKVTPSDTVVIYFSGHSIEPVKYAEYLAVYDSITPFNKKDYKIANNNSFSKAITAQELHESISLISSSTVVILDTHANQNYVDLAETGHYTLLLSTSPGFWAYERTIDEKVYGFFTYSLVEQIRRLASGVKLGHLHELVTDRMQSLGGKQLPIFIGGREEYFLASHNYLLDFFDFGERRNYSVFTHEQLEQQYRIAAKRLTAPFPEFYQSLGEAFIEKENYERAIDCFHIALEQSSNDICGLLIALGKAQFLLGQYSRAYETVQQYLSASGFQGCTTQIQEVVAELEQLNAARRYALLVGINRYSAPGVLNPEGAVNDVLALKAVLIEKHHFQEEDIKLLIDDDATCAKILSCFKELVSISRNAPALFFFAGNGSLNNNADLTILGADSRQNNVFDIKLDELAEVVGNQPTNLITVIDAGWANALLSPKGGRVAVPDSRSLPSKQALTSSMPDGQIRSGSNLINVRDLSSPNFQIGYISIYSKSIQFGLYEKTDEIQGERIFPQPEGHNGKMHGILTYALLEGLQSDQASHFTYQELVELVSEKLQAAAPVVLGTGLSASVFKDFFKEQNIHAAFRQIAQEPFRQLIPILKRLIEQRNGIDPEGYLNLGIIYYVLGEHQKSIAALELSLAQFSEQQSQQSCQSLIRQQDYSEAHYWLGRLLYENKQDLARAVSELRLATQQNPANIPAYYYLGETLRLLMKQEFTVEAKQAIHTYLKCGAPLGQRKELQNFLRTGNK